MTTVTKGLWVPLEAKPGREEDVARFLEGATPLVEEEPGTISWFWSGGMGAPFRRATAPCAG